VTCVVALSKHTHTHTLNEVQLQEFIWGEISTHPEDGSKAHTKSTNDDHSWGSYIHIWLSLKTLEALNHEM